VNEDFEFVNFIICDEIRYEVLNKQIIIGAYAGVILMPQIPWIATQFAIRLQFFGKKRSYENVVGKVVKPNGNELFIHNTGAFHVKYLQYPTSVIFTSIMPQFDQTGDYQICVSMDAPFRPIGSFTILTAADLPKED
jgi:hypothetical protein